MKRNRITTTLLIVCMSLLLAFSLTACGDKPCEHIPNADDSNCLTEITCSVCGTVTTPARDSHTGGTATCTEKAVCTVCSTAFGAVDANNHIDENTDHICDRSCGETNIGTHEDKNNDHNCEYGCTTSIGTHADTNSDHNCDYGCSTTIGVHSDSENDDDHTCDYGCGVSLEDCKGGTATCVSGKLCEICGVEYDTTKNPDYHTSTEFTYNDNLDGTHTKAHKCCEVVENATEKHTFDANNKCLCGVASLQIEQALISNLFGDYWRSDTEEALDGVSGDVQDKGKTAWEEGDQIIITLTSKYYGTQTAVIIFNDGYWGTSVSFSYLADETPTVSVIYAPCYEVTEEGVMQLRSGMQLGMTEYLVGEYEIGDGLINVSFEDATRDYSRLRIVGLANQTLTVTTTGFTPVGATSEATEAYTLTTDDNGNAFLYGTFAEGATVSVKHGDVVLKDYTFTAENNPNGTDQGKSYALDARPIIDGTLGGKTTAEESDITALVEQLKTYVDNGITTIIVTGETPAMINMGNYTSTAIGEAIYRLSKDVSYNGKIDLILSDVTKIVDYEFQKAYALNSINLPKVTTVGESAFEDCWYLQELTFGSVVTLIKNDLAFSNVGASVDGCDLVLNRGQVNAATEYQPDDLNKMWWKLKWKSITII